jgi:hypothetical protein
MNTQILTDVTTARDCETKFGKLALKCVSCQPTEDKSGFILKLQHKSEITQKTPFGLKKVPVNHTFYMKVSEECKVGFEAPMNLDDFRIVERVFEVEDDTTNETTTMWLKWLHLN